MLKLTFTKIKNAVWVKFIVSSC